MAISWEYDEGKEQELYGKQAYDTDQDFSSKSEGKKHINGMFNLYECNNCGGRNVDGSGVQVEIRRVKMFKQHERKKFFGGTKFVDEHWKTIWRVGGVKLKPGGFFGGAGVITCRSCKTKVKGVSAFWGQWASNLAQAQRDGKI